jgi:hypothetical protein
MILLPTASNADGTSNVETHMTPKKTISTEKKNENEKM